MPYQAIAAGLSGAMGLVGGLAQYHWNEALASRQNDYNVAMWKMNNEYNSPQAQMRRYEEAGLNPALLYGQVSSGNASQAPQQVVPEAPHLSEDMRNLAQAFNIEGLRQAIAERKKAEADARLAGVAAANATDQREAEHSVGSLNEFDPQSGLWRRKTDDELTVEAETPRLTNYQRRLLRETGAISNREYYYNKFLMDNFRVNSLLHPRGELIRSQRFLNWNRSYYLAPQIQNARYGAKYFPVQYWIGNVKNGVQAVTPFMPYKF